MRWNWQSLGLRLSVLAFSVLLWTIAPRPQGTDTAQSFFVDQRIVAPVVLQGLDDQLEVVESPDWVTVQLRSNRLHGSIVTERVQVYADLSGYGAGIHTVPVTVVPPIGVQVEGVEPNVVTVTLETVTAELFPVQVAALGLPSDASIEVLMPEPDAVQVVGRADRLQKVAETVAHIRIETNEGTQSGHVRVQAVDETGLAVQDVRIEPESVFVSVIVSSKQDNTDESPHDEEAVPNMLKEPLATEENEIMNGTLD